MIVLLTLHNYIIIIMRSVCVDGSSVNYAASVIIIIIIMRWVIISYHSTRHYVV